MKQIAGIILAIFIFLPIMVHAEEGQKDMELKTAEELEAEEDNRIYEEKTVTISTGAQTIRVTVLSCPELAGEVLKMVNEERATVGLSALKADEKLAADALQRAAETTVSWGHTRPDGTKCTTLSKRFSGENIARKQTTSEWVMEDWMESQGHRKNILKKGYERIAVACVKYEDTFYWVQLFGY